MYLRLRNFAERFSILCNANGYQQFKMADHKPEILISQSVCNIAAQFQRLYPCFQGPEIQRNYSLLCVMQAEGRNPRWATHQQEILMFVSRHLGFLTYRASHTIKNSSNEFFVLENMGITVGI